jgi:hypothetical protein
MARFESLSHTERNAPETRNINHLATPSRSLTLPQPRNSGSTQMWGYPARWLSLLGRGRSGYPSVVSKS